MKRVFILLIAGTVLSGVAAYAATQRVEAQEVSPSTPVLQTR
ncbi:MAG: hypothetical protein OSB00_16430 [Sphingomonas bacterium]|nr:hypothetical protein [Sphingomonas bacterium]